MNEDPLQQKLQRLSMRERTIVERYAGGQTYKEIAAALRIAPNTVRNHLARIYKKLDIAGKAELIAACNTESRGTSAAEPDYVTSSTERALAGVQAQQRAITEVLRVISQSPGDLDDVFDVILDHALQLSHSQLGIVYLYNEDVFEAKGLKSVPAAFQEYLQSQPLRPGPKTGLGRMARQRRIIHIHDVRSDDVYRQGDPLRQATVELGGARSFVAIPMINRDALIGAFTIYRQEVKPFSDEELELLQVFSNQAAIAVTITRLIDEHGRLERRVQELSASDPLN